MLLFIGVGFGIIISHLFPWYGIFINYFIYLVQTNKLYQWIMNQKRSMNFLWSWCIMYYIPFLYIYIYVACVCSLGLKWFKGQFWSKNNRRTIETRVTWAYTRAGLYAAVYGIYIQVYLVNLTLFSYINSFFVYVIAHISYKDLLHSNTYLLIYCFILEMCLTKLFMDFVSCANVNICN